jgi:hypothetical protein
VRLVHQDATVRQREALAGAPPAHRRNWPMEAAIPKHTVRTSQLTYCIVS